MESLLFDDVMTSYWCGNNVEYDFCNDPQGSDCSGHNGQKGAAARSTKTGQDNKLSWAVLRPYDAQKKGAVTFFSDTGCTGQAGRLYATENVDDVAMYLQSDLEVNGVDIDAVSTMMIPQTYMVKMYDGGAFDEGEFDVTGPFFEYVNGHYEMACYDIQSEWIDNSMASAKIYRDPS